MNFIRSAVMLHELPKEKFVLAVADCEKVTEWLTDNRGIEIRYGCTDGDVYMPPTFADTFIRFDGPNWELGHNGFGISQHVWTPPTKRPRRKPLKPLKWECNTDGKPYDLSVCCCMIALAYHLGDAFQVNHPGADDANWLDACRTCQKVLGYGKQFEQRMNSLEVVP